METPLLQRMLRTIQEDYAYWKRAIVTNQTKIDLCGHTDAAYMWWKTGEEYNPKDTIPTVKHGGVNIMLWGCFSASGTGNLVKVEGIMKKEQYKKKLRENVKQSAAKLGLGRRFIFQYDKTQSTLRSQ